MYVGSLRVVVTSDGHVMFVSRNFQSSRPSRQGYPRRSGSKKEGPIRILRYYQGSEGQAYDSGSSSMKLEGRKRNCVRGIERLETEFRVKLSKFKRDVARDGIRETEKWFVACCSHR